jgi:hypothetical protein
MYSSNVCWTFLISIAIWGFSFPLFFFHVYLTLLLSNFSKLYRIFQIRLQLYHKFIMYTPLETLEERSEQGSRPSEDYDGLLAKESQDFAPIRKSSKPRSILLQIFLTLVISLFAFALGTWFGSDKHFEPSGRGYLEHVQHYCM